MANVIKRIGNDANMARKIYIDKMIFWSSYKYYDRN